MRGKHAAVRPPQRAYRRQAHVRCAIAQVQRARRQHRRSKCLRAFRKREAGSYEGSRTCVLGRRECAAGRGWQRPRDERAARRLRLEPSLRHQLGDRRDHRVAMDLQRVGKRPAARQRITGLEPAAADRVDDRARDLQERRHPPIAIEIERERPWASHARILRATPQTGPTGIGELALVAQTRMQYSGRYDPPDWHRCS